jgi:signal transduction histidine kinase
MRSIRIRLSQFHGLSLCWGHMRLHVFIDEHIDAILDDWDAFAQTLRPAADSMTLPALRDHAKEILWAVALDIKTRQSAVEQHEKSLGHSPGDHPERSAASLHGALRQASAFTLLQLSAEYRALRASVLRLWLPHVSAMTSEIVAEITRFNEAIDQALAESIITFSEQAERTRDLFLAVLGHDLRAPIATMSLAGQLLTRPDVTVAAANQVGVRVRRSASIMSAMVADLLGYTKTQLGAGLPLVLSTVNLETACKTAVGDASAAHPDTRQGRGLTAKTVMASVLYTAGSMTQFPFGRKMD